jgi:transposase
MNIMAIDLGKFHSCVCFYDPSDGRHRFEKIPTTPQRLHDLLVEHPPERLVIEACHLAGWVVDLSQALGIATQVANANSEGWRWKNVRRKADADDALKLCKLSAMNQLSLVHVPNRAVRQWRSLIGYRGTLVERRTAIRNSIRSLLDAQGLNGEMPRGSKGFNPESIQHLKSLARALERCGAEELWRGQLDCELVAYQQVQELIEPANRKLDELAEANEPVKRLKTIPGVGNRMAEIAVALIDDPDRFKRGRQVGAYAGLTPKRYQSGERDRSGRISRAGNGRLRKLLVQIAWGMVQGKNRRGREIFNHVCRGSPARRKQAAVALARRVLIWCWAMMRDGSEWDEQRAGRGRTAVTSG